VHIKANPEDGSHITIIRCNRAYFAKLASRGLQETLNETYLIRFSKMSWQEKIPTAPSSLA